MTTYYPTLNQFWPAVRARNFVKELGLTPGNYTKNMETLSARAGVHPKQMCHINPLTFAERNFTFVFHFSCHARMIKILGESMYSRLSNERKIWWGSANWAYHKLEPIPPYVEPVRTLAEPDSEAIQEPELAPELAVVDDLRVPTPNSGDCPVGTIYHANKSGEYADFLEILTDYLGPDCWAIKVNDEVLFNFYNDMSVKERIQLSILHDKIADYPHILFMDMFTKKKDSTIMIDMYSNANLVVKITYRATDETLSLIATNNSDRHL